MMDWSNGGAWMNGYGITMMLLFWGVLVALVIWGVSRMTRQSPQSFGAESPRQILDRRFASGEIEAEQYGEARRVIEGRGAASGAKGS